MLAQLAGARVGLIHTETQDSLQRFMCLWLHLAVEISNGCSGF
jgi:hypothetical protein